MAYSSSRQEDIDLEFWEACRAGDMSTFSRLLQDARVSRPVRGTTPIVAAVQWGQARAYKSLLRDPRISVNDQVTATGGHTLLHWSVMCSNHQALLYLSRVPGVDINSRNTMGESPLMLAIKTKNAVAVEMLLRMDDVNLDQEEEEEKFEDAARKWMDVRSRKDSSFRRDMSRVILVLLEKARERRSQERREREEAERLQRESDRRERLEAARTQRQERLAARERSLRERLDQRRSDHWLFHERQRQRRQEMRDQEDARLEEVVRRFELSNMTEAAVVSLDSSDEEEREFVVVEAAGEAADKFDQITRDLAGEEDKLTKTVIRLTNQDQDTTSGQDQELDDTDEVGQSVNEIHEMVEEKIKSILAMIEKVRVKISEREKCEKPLDSRHAREMELVGREHKRSQVEMYRGFKSDNKEISARHKAELETWSRDASQTCAVFHRQDVEETELQDRHEKTAIALFQGQEEEKREMVERHKKEVDTFLAEDEMMASLRTQSKELHRHLSKLTTKSEVVPCPECPVCYESLQPPAKILQCVSGHLTCLPCASKMERFDCPMCKQDFTGRAIAMEQFLRTLFHAE